MNIMINGHHREETLPYLAYSFEYICYVGNDVYDSGIAVCYYNKDFRRWQYPGSFSQRATSLPYAKYLLIRINQYASENISI